MDFDICDYGMSLKIKAQLEREIFLSYVTIFFKPHFNSRRKKFESYSQVLQGRLNNLFDFIIISTNS